MKKLDPKIFEPHPLTKVIRFNPKLWGQGYPYSASADLLFLGCFWLIALLWAFAGLRWLWHALVGY